MRFSSIQYPSASQLNSQAEIRLFKEQIILCNYDSRVAVAAASAAVVEILETITVVAVVVKVVILVIEVVEVVE